MKVLNNRILVKRSKDELIGLTDSVKETIQSGLLHLPDKFEGLHKKVSGRGEIIAFGEACKNRFNIGDYCWFAKFSYNELDENIVFIVDKDVHAIGSFDEIDKIKMINDRTLVEVVSEKQKSIEIVEDKEPTKGRVVLSGDPDILKGSLVVFRPGSGEEIVINGKEFKVLKTDEILFTVENDEIPIGSNTSPQ